MTSSCSPPSRVRRSFADLPSVAVIGVSLGLGACASPPAVLPADAGANPDAARTDDAGSADAAVRPGDAAHVDAPSSPDAAVVIEGACFEGAARIATSVAGPSSRAHMRAVDLAAFEHGFVVVISDNGDGAETLVVTDRSGNVIAREPAPLLTHRVLVVGSSALVFGGSQVFRMDLDATGIVRRYPGQYVGGLFARNEGLRALEPQPDGTVHALTHHYLEGEGRSVLRLSILMLDDAVEPGLVQRIDDLAAIDGIEPFTDRFFLRGDHLRVASTTHVLDVQLGLGSAGSGTPIGVRVWSDEPWTLPYAIVDLTRDGQSAVTGRASDGEMRLHLEALPPATAAPIPLLVDLHFGAPAAEALEVSDVLFLATSDGLHARDRFSGAALAMEGAFAATRNVPVQLALAPDGSVAAAFVEADGVDRHVALRCARLAP